MLTNVKNAAETLIALLLFLLSPGSPLTHSTNLHHFCITGLCILHPSLSLRSHVKLKPHLFSSTAKALAVITASAVLSSMAAAWCIQNQAGRG